MGILKPYHRTYRPVNPSLTNAGYSSSAYISDKEYCKSGHSYVRAFQLILKDLENLFEYIEPSQESMNTYSYKIHSLFMRICIEIEANFKAILNENIYTPQLNRFNQPILNISVYKLINKTHHLSKFKVGLPQWAGQELLVFEPYKNWDTQDERIEWYQAYNMSKHDRQDNFRLANMNNLLNAAAGLLVLISSQFRQEDFSPAYDSYVSDGSFELDMEPSLGEVFLIKFPNDWTAEEYYEFDWSKLKTETERFQKFNYDGIVS